MPQARRKIDRMVIVQQKCTNKKARPIRCRHKNREHCELSCDHFVNMATNQSATAEYPDVPINTLPPMQDIETIRKRLKLPDYFLTNRPQVGDEGVGAHDAKAMEFRVRQHIREFHLHEDAVC
jgi:hypothetical protein